MQAACRTLLAASPFLFFVPFPLLARSTDGLTFAAIVEEIRETPTETESESARDIAERLGLVGAFESGVTDLSTNPVHISGFGK